MRVSPFAGPITAHRLYLDGVLLHAPFHMLEGQNFAGSARPSTATCGRIELYEGAYPVRFEDRSAGALEVHTRDGNATPTPSAPPPAPPTRGSWGRSAGRKKRGSWLAGARKSYLQYILERTFPPFAGLRHGGRARPLTYDLTAKNNITLYVLESYSGLDAPPSASNWASIR